FTASYLRGAGIFEYSSRRIGVHIDIIRAGIEVCRQVEVCSGWERPAWVQGSLSIDFSFTISALSDHIGIDRSHERLGAVFHFLNHPCFRNVKTIAILAEIDAVEPVTRTKNEVIVINW